MSGLRKVEMSASMGGRGAHGNLLLQCRLLIPIDCFVQKLNGLLLIQRIGHGSLRVQARYINYPQKSSNAEGCPRGPRKCTYTFHTALSLRHSDGCSVD